MDDIWLQVVIIIILVLANGVFAASEIAVVSSRRNRLQQQAEEGSRSAQTALELIEEPNRFLATVQVGITLIGIFAGAFGGSRLAVPLAEIIRPFPIVGGATASAVALTLVVVLITYLSLVLGELVPKRLALQNAEAIATLVAPGMRLLSRLAAPVVWFLTISTQAILRLLGRNNEPEEQVTEEDILSMVRAGTQGGTVEAAEQEFIERVFDFTDVPARSIMTPRSEIFALDIATPLDQAVQQTIAAGYSRVPVYRGHSDKIEGVVHVKDLLRATHSHDQQIQLSDLVREPVYVLEHQSLAEVLQMFRQSHLHMALVVDEYGQIDGLLTLEDVLEELTGDIADEHDENEPMVVLRDDGSYLVDGLLSYVDAEHELGLPAREAIEEDELPDFDTIAGLILALMEHIPSTGEHITWRGWYFEVVDMDGVRIDKVLVRHIATSNEQTRNEGALATGAVLPLPDAQSDTQRQRSA